MNTEEEEKLLKRLKEVRDALNKTVEIPKGGLAMTRDVPILYNSIIQHEAKRLNRKLGRDHPRVKRLEANLNHNLKVINDLRVEERVARISFPMVEEKDAVIQGFVLDENQTGINNLTVSVEDKDGNTIQYVDTVKTDEYGHYSITMQPDTIAKLSEVEGAHLVFHNQGGELVKRETSLFTVSEGDRIIKEVVAKREIVSVPITRKVARTVATKTRIADTIPLEKIKGIGGKKAELLRKEGIGDVRAFYNTDDEVLRRILGNLDFSKMKKECKILLDDTGTG